MAICFEQTACPFYFGYTVHPSGRGVLGELLERRLKIFNCNTLFFCCMKSGLVVYVQLLELLLMKVVDNYLLVCLFYQ